jgi:hypothetical protein
MGTCLAKGLRNAESGLEANRWQRRAQADPGRLT